MTASIETLTFQLQQAQQQIRQLEAERRSWLRQTETLQVMVEGTSGAIGEDFFLALVRSLGVALKMRLIYLVEYSGNNSYHTLAVWENEAPKANHVYRIEGHPCEIVMRGETVFIDANLGKQYQTDPIWQSYLGLPLVNQEGKIIGCITAWHDQPLLEDPPLELIKVFSSRAVAEVEALQAEREHQYSEARFRTVFDQSPLGMNLVDLDNRFIMVNPRLCEMLGYSDEELRLTTFIEVTHPEDRAKDAQLADRIFSGEITFGSVEKRYICKDGSILWVNLTAGLVRDEQGNPLYGIGMSEDITERKLAEQALHQSEKHFQTLFESAPIGLVMTNREGRLTQTNIALREMLGYTAQELEQMSFEDITFQKDPEDSRRIFRALAKGKHAYYRVEEQYRRRGGEIIWVNTAIFDMSDIDGHYVFSMAAVEDITERKRIEAERVIAYRTLEQRVAARTHEIERRRRVSDSLRDILAVLNSDRPLDGVLNMMIAKAPSLLDAQAGAICRFEQHPGSMLGVEAVYGILPDRVLTSLAPLEEAIIGEMQKGELFVVSDMTEYSKEYLGGQMPYGRVFLSLLVVPLMIKGKVDGCVRLFYSLPRPDPFPGEEIALSITFADQIALAIENAVLRQRVKSAAAIEERNRLARDLHDAVSQTLWSAVLIADVLPEIWRQNEQKGLEKLDQLKLLTANAQAEMRALLLELRPGALVELPLDQLLGRLVEAVASRTGLSITMHFDLNEKLPADVHETLYRITQESLNNIVKHASATHVSVVLEEDGNSLTLTIIDNGIGFDAVNIAPGHLGLGIMLERARAIGADLVIEKGTSGGTQLQMSWERTR